MFNRKDRIIAMLMLSPSLILLAIFVYAFIFRTFYISLTDWGENPNQPVMALPEDLVITVNDPLLANYQRLMTNLAPENAFRNSLVNAFFFTIFFIGGCLVFGLVLALLLDQKIVGEGIFRTIFLFPMSLSFIVTGTIWAWLLRRESGINVLPSQLLGRTPPPSQEMEPWINSTVVQLPFRWEDGPHYLSLIGVFILFFLIFRYLGSEDDRLGRVASWLSQFGFVTFITAFIGGLTVGHTDWLWLGSALVGVASVVIRVALNREDFGNPEFASRNWKPVMWLGVGIGIVILIRVVGVWDVLWPPLDFPARERPPVRGYNAALTGVLIAAIWQMGGYTMAMLLAGLRGIPEELREAARVDGCSEVRVYFSIVFPMLRPIMLSAVIILGHISLKIFDLVYAMAGARNATTIMPSILVFDWTNNLQRFGAASAIAMVMLFFVALVIVPYLWASLRKDSN